MRNAAGKFGHVKATLDGAFGVLNRLTVLTANNFSQLIRILHQQFAKLKYDGSPSWRSHRSPFQLCGKPCLHRAIDLFRRGIRAQRVDFASRRVEYVAGATTSAIHPCAIDIMIKRFSHFYFPVYFVVSLA